MIAEMAKRLVAISMTLGFKESNTGVLMLSLSGWIKVQFGDISMQEVAIAFDLVTAKKIGNDIRHYNSFSKQYIGDVLSAYKTWRSKQIKLFEDHKKTLAITQNTNTGATPQQMYDTIKKIALETGKIMKVADWSGAFNYAWKSGLIHRMNEQERTEYKKKVESALKTEKMGGIEIGDYSLQTEIHKRIMQAHFQEMIDKNGKV